VGLSRAGLRESEVRCGQVGQLFLMHAEETADPSTSLRFGRDDELYGLAGKADASRSG
jgi:hypothetical protein